MTLDIYCKPESPVASCGVYLTCYRGRVITIPATPHTHNPHPCVISLTVLPAMYLSTVLLQLLRGCILLGSPEQ